MGGGGGGGGWGTRLALLGNLHTKGCRGTALGAARSLSCIGCGRCKVLQAALVGTMLEDATSEMRNTEYVYEGSGIQKI